MAVLLAGLVGCSEKTPGDATPTPQGQNTSAPSIPTDGAEPTDPTQSSTGAGGGDGTQPLQPCDLLTQQEQAGLQLGPGQEDTIGSARVCMWQASGSHTVGVSIFDDLGLADVQSKSGAQPLTIGSHDAVQYTGGVSTCSIALAVSETSRVDVSGVANGDMTRGCAVANQAARLVEPKLP
jgi:hypothetical protein